jgi:hypothetical protein
MESHLKHPLYHIWQTMKARCLNPKAHAYERYGGRGITVCESWRISFERFVLDVGPRPSLRHTIDRFPDNDGNYEPGNVRWATREEQSDNSNRFRRMITANGKTQKLERWAAETGLAKSTIFNRLERGWSDQMAVQINPKRRNHEYRNSKTNRDSRTNQVSATN